VAVVSFVCEKNCMLRKTKWGIDCKLSSIGLINLVELLQECVRGALREKIVVLVTHQVDFLHNVDLILVSDAYPPCKVQLLIYYFTLVLQSS